MPTDITTFYIKREFIGDFDAESLLEKAKKATTPEAKDSLIEDVKNLLDENGMVQAEKKQGMFKIGLKKFGFNFRMVWSRIFRTAFAKNFDTAVKTLSSVKAYVLNKRAEEARANEEQQRLQEEAKNAAEVAKKVFEEQKAAREARIADLKQEIEVLDQSITEQQAVKTKASEDFRAAEQAFAAAEKSVSDAAQAKLDLSKRKTNLEKFLPLLEEGMKSNWPWSTQIALKDKLREAYKEIKQSNYPEREFGVQFNNAKAQELKDLITAELNNHPQITLKAEERYITANQNLPIARGNKESAKLEFDTAAEKLNKMEDQKADLMKTLEDLEPKFIPAAAAPAAEGEAQVEEVVAIEVPPVIISKKDEMLQAIREKVGGAEGDKLAQLFDALIKEESVKGFTYDAASKKYTVEFTGVQRVWVPSSDVSGGVVMSLGENRAKAFKFSLSPKQMEIDYDNGIGSYGNLSAFAKSAVIVKLKVDGDSVASTGKVGKFGGTKSVKFDEMLKAWQQGKKVPTDPKLYEGFWSKNDKNKYDWQK